MTPHTTAIRQASAIDTIVRIMTTCAPLEVEEAGDENNVTVFTCPTCGGDGSLAADEVLTMHASPSDFPVGAVGIQCFGIGDGHGELQRALNELPKEIEALRSDLTNALARAAAAEGERDAYRQRECRALEVVAEYLDVLENAPDELTTDGLHGLFAPGNWSDVLSQRDTALARLAACEGLLREAHAEMRKQEPWNMLRSYSDTIARISAHLSKQEPAP